MISEKTQRSIDRALKAIAEEKPAMYNAEEFSSSRVTRTFFTLRLRTKEQEIFDVLFLDNRNRLIACESMFYGTIDSASVYPREILKRALSLNAAAIIVAHNHPSGNPNPSKNDRIITKKLAEGMALVDMKLLDHIIVGNPTTYSFAEQGDL